MDDAVTRAYKDTFETESGKVVIADLVRQCPLVTVPCDVHQALVNEGRRALLMHIMTILQRDASVTYRLRRRRTV